MKEQSIPELAKEDSLFVKTTAKYIPYWPLFLLFLVLGAGLVYSYFRYAVPQYEANASLIIKDEKKGSDDAKFMESLNIINTKKIIENEIDIIQSRPILKKVVTSLRLYSPIYYTNGISPVSAYDEFPLTVEVRNPDSIPVTTANIPLQFSREDSSVTINAAITGKLNTWLQTPYGDLRFSINNSSLPTENIHPIYFSLLTIDEAVQKIQDNLKVTATNKLSSVINLRYRDDKPKLAEDILNGIILAYNEMSTAEKKALAKNTLSFIEARLNTVGYELDSIESSIQKYKANQGAVDISTQGQLFLQNVSANDQKLSDINMQLMVIGQVEKLLSSNDNSLKILPSSLGVNDATLSQLMINLNTAELEHEKLKKTVAENNPLLVANTDQINKLRHNIADHIQTQRASLETSRENILATNNGYNSILHSIPTKERQLLEISRDKNIKSEIYSFLLQKREESELSYESTLSDSNVINFAHADDSPVSPNKLLILGIAILAVFGAPVSLVNLRETLNPNILYRKEIESLTALPIIGEVGHNRSKKPLVIEAGKRSFIAEEFRKIRNALLFKGVNGKHKKILVTSGISGEGKSFVANNLAISYAVSGRKTVLLDFDLHNSSLNRIFKRENMPGVCEYLAGSIDVKDIIFPCPGYDNLYLVAAGNLQDNMSELIENGRANELISYLGENFDITIVDSEPVELVSDGRILSMSCDATIYVVRHLYTPKILLKRFDQNNTLSPLHNPYIVFNGVKTRGFVKGQYGYGYGYVYGEKELSRWQKRKMKTALAQA